RGGGWRRPDRAGRDRGAAVSRASGPELVAEACPTCGRVRVVAACLVEGRQPCAECGAGLIEQIAGESGAAGAVCELRGLAEVLNGEQAPIDELPFALVAPVRRESKRDTAARVRALPFEGSNDGR